MASGKKSDMRDLIPRKLRVTKHSRFHKSKKGYDRREGKESIEEQLEDSRPVKGARKIIVNGRTYYWLYKRSRIIIWSDDGTKHVYFDSEVTGMTPDNIERGKWKKWFSIGPGDIAKWIKEQVEVQHEGEEQKRVQRKDKTPERIVETQKKKRQEEAVGGTNGEEQIVK